MSNRILLWDRWLYVYAYLFCRKMTLQLAGEGDTLWGSSLPEKVCGWKKDAETTRSITLSSLIISVFSHFQKVGHCPASLHLLGWFLAPPPPSDSLTLHWLRYTVFSAGPILAKFPNFFSTLEIISGNNPISFSGPLLSTDISNSQWRIWKIFFIYCQPGRKVAKAVH